MELWVIQLNFIYFIEVVKTDNTQTSPTNSTIKAKIKTNFNLKDKNQRQNGASARHPIYFGEYFEIYGCLFCCFSLFLNFTHLSGVPEGSMKYESCDTRDQVMKCGSV